MKKQSEPKTPLARFGEFELLKAVAIIGLPAIHLMEEAMEGGFASPELARVGSFIVGLCVFGPSVFMMCMGFGIGGGKTKADNIRRNGIQFLLIGAILNIFRWFIPGVIQLLTIHTKLIEDVEFCLQSDIYYFVGIFFVLYSFFKKRNISAEGMLFVSILMLTANMLLTPFTGKYITNPIAASLIGNIVYVNETSCFPLLSWAIFPSIGIVLGDLLKKADDEQREFVMKRIFDFSFVLFVSFMVFLYEYNIDFIKVLVSPSNNYITDLPNVLLLVSLALFSVSLTYYLCKLIGDTPFMRFMLRVSVFIIPFYLLQWVIIAWIFYLLTILRMPPGCFGLGWYIFSVIAVTIFCIFVSTKYGMKMMKQLFKITKLKKKKHSKKLQEV